MPRCRGWVLLGGDGGGVVAVTEVLGGLFCEIWLVAVYPSQILGGLFAMVHWAVVVVLRHCCPCTRLQALHF